MVGGATVAPVAPVQPAPVQPVVAAPPASPAQTVTQDNSAAIAAKAQAEQNAKANLQA